MAPSLASSAVFVLIFAWFPGTGASHGANEGEGRWVLGNDGESCYGACARLGQLCSEKHWTHSEEELKSIAKGLGQTCESIESGSVQYDPSIAGTDCGWHGNEGMPVYGGDGSRCSALPPWSTQRFCYCEGKLKTTSLPYDCFGNLRSAMDWSRPKRDWCCENEGLGCTTTSLAYDCDADYPRWSTDWSEGKKEWCCSHQARGCQTTTATVVTTSTSAPFDCGTGYANWHVGWSDMKKDWCCRFRNLGCTTSTTLSPFDCMAGYGNRDLAWSDSKKEWCCKREGRGCPPAEDRVLLHFNCEEGYIGWQTGWSKAKKDYCCAEKSLACPFNCVAGFSNWRQGWSYSKKEWCCRYKQLGCEQ